ncbi:MAG: NAD-dependent DNA ligase LigA [Lachnospiraceae bacterium]|nr:NAD-dependent DNA ligase LigA [Lachnospiraceae bacterium]
MEEKLQRMRELGRILKEASKAYYQDAEEIMSNYEYDRLYDELAALEKETGTVLAGSPTVTVGYEVLSSLPKERHETPMLSLDKTKDVGALAEWLGDHKGMLSWKLDGLTVVLTYDNHELVKAVTRGNGEVGEVITPNARVFQNIPLKIPYEGTLVLRGEALIRYSDFEEINAQIPEAEARYKNPRNLCSGSVRQLDSRITASRRVRFFAFTMVTGPAMAYRSEEQAWLREQGFDVVENVAVTAQTLPEAVADFAARIAQNDFPSDGLVLTFDDIAYGRSLGSTAKFPRSSIAFKWADETAQTTLLSVEWSASRTGLINPVAVFAPVELEGTTVSRASLHNISYIEDLALGIGDEITVYKANMIIPQIAENLTRSGHLPIPDTCPVCGGPSRVQDENGVKTLMCDNPACLAKKIKLFTLFVSRDAMNLDGLSEATMEKFIAAGYVKEPADLFRLNRYREEITGMEGFGVKSYENLIASAEKARTTTPPNLLYSLGIPNIGLSNARLIARHFGQDFAKMRSAGAEELTEIEGVGSVIAGAYTEYFADPENCRIVDDLLEEIRFDESGEPQGESLAGMTFVITGSLETYANRGELKNKLESMGAKVVGSVSAKTTYLINNDAQSSSSKNQTARKLGIPILTEEELNNMLREKGGA